jgi:polysaccharide biosynthesis/export protein
MKILLLVAVMLCPLLAFAQEGQNDVRLRASDTIEIRFFYTPELNKIQTIRPDGKIVLQLIGEITAAGKTPNELTQELVKKYTRYFKQLDVAVFVESYGSRGVYVGGGVNTPGEIPILRNLTVLEAIMQAGGVNATTASLKNVVVVRLKEGKYERYVLDLEGVLLGTDNKPFYLMPLDVVYVPPRIGIP